MEEQQPAAKRIKIEDIFTEAQISRNGTFKKLDFEYDSDCGDLEAADSKKDPEIIPRILYTQLKESYDFLEKEKEKVDLKLENLKKKFCEFQKQYDQMKIEYKEITDLRTLNRQLQERLLNLPVTKEECLDVVRNHEEIQTESDSEMMEVDIGAGISINRKVYEEMWELDHVRKFTKSLAVAIWGSNILAGRSVLGRTCRNRYGPKKQAPDVVQTGDHLQELSKRPLTPEKLAVISGQMRKYMEKKGKDCAEIESEIKKRNRYISDKIQEICKNIAKIEFDNKSFNNL